MHYWNSITLLNIISERTKFNWRKLQRIILPYDNVYYSLAIPCFTNQFEVLINGSIIAELDMCNVHSSIKIIVFDLEHWLRCHLLKCKQKLYIYETVLISYSSSARMERI